MNKKINKIIEELTSNEPVIAEEFSNEAYCYYCGSPSDSNMSREVDHAEDCIITLAHEVKLASLKAQLTNMNYSEFLFSQLFMNHVTDKGITTEIEYDLIFETVKSSYEAFNNSEFNIDTVSEYDCIIAYLKEEIKPCLIYATGTDCDGMYCDRVYKFINVTEAKDFTKDLNEGSDGLIWNLKINF